MFVRMIMQNKLKSQGSDSQQRAVIDEEEIKRRALRNSRKTGSGQQYQKLRKTIQTQRKNRITAPL
jgi:hypothetical protein